MSFLVGHELIHLAVGAALAITVYLRTRSRLAAVVLVGWSLVIDMDHLVDYVAARGVALDVEAIISGTYFAESGRLFVPLHSWEMAAAALAVGSVANDTRSAVVLAVGLATIGHLVVDQLAYGMPAGSYFLALRAAHGFLAPESW